MILYPLVNYMEHLKIFFLMQKQRSDIEDYLTLCHITYLNGHFLNKSFHVHLICYCHCLIF